MTYSYLDYQDILLNTNFIGGAAKNDLSTVSGETDQRASIATDVNGNYEFYYYTLTSTSDLNSLGYYTSGVDREYTQLPSGGPALSTNQAAILGSVLTATTWSVSFSDVAKITFSSGTVSNADIVFGSTTNGGTPAIDSNIGAYELDYSNNYSALKHGDIWINNDATEFWNETDAGAPGAWVMHHEIMHALGVDIYDINEDPTNDNLNDQKYTTTSYIGLGGMNPAGADNEVLPTGLQLFDIAALQEIYGRNYTTRNADTIYDSNGAFASSRPNDAFIYTIWDGGGTDEINLADYDDHVLLDLRQGMFSSVGKSADSSYWGSRGTGLADDNLAIAYHAVIENAVGTNDTSSGDIIVGNEWVNELVGLQGDDQLFGDGWVYDNDPGFSAVEAPNPSKPSSDDDVLDPGRGSDFAFGGYGNDTFRAEGSLTGLEADFYHGGGRLGGWELFNSEIAYAIDGSDTVDYSELGYGLKIDLSNAYVGGGTAIRWNSATDMTTGAVDILVSIENITGSAFDDHITGNSAANVLLGGAGNDILIGGTGNDTYHATLNSGQNLIYDDWNGSNKLIFADDVDISDVTILESENDLKYQHTDGSEYILQGILASPSSRIQVEYDQALGDGSLGQIVYSGTTGNDTYNGSLSGVGSSNHGYYSHIAFGGDGEDVIYGGAYYDYLIGGDGNDFIHASAGGGYLNGGDGNDYISAVFVNTADFVEIIGGYGNDEILFGGSSGTFNISDSFGNDFYNDSAGDYASITISDLSGNDWYDKISVNVSITDGAGDDYYDIPNLHKVKAVFIEDVGGRDLVSFSTRPYSYLSSTSQVGSDLLIDFDSGAQITFLNYFVSEEFRPEQATFQGIGRVPFDLLANPSNYIMGTTSNNTLSGTSADEHLLGFSGHDTLSGGSGNDILEGGSGNDTINGGIGVDTASYALAALGVTVDLSNTGAQATGGAGTDTIIDVENLTGSDYADNLTGDAGDNVLSGNAGDDILIGGAGADTLNGGDGIDEVSYESDSAGVSVYLSSGTAIDGNSDTDTITGVENVKGSAFADTIHGSSVANALRGEDGNDTVHGWGGADFIYGGEGNDILNGDDSANSATYASGGNDYIEGGAGADLISGGVGDDEIHAGSGNDTVWGGAGSDTIYGDDGDDTLYGDFTSASAYDAADTIYGGVGNDTISGSGGDDLLYGGDGIDYIYGHGGEDEIWGDGGDDHLFGGDDDDIIHGGEGSDNISGNGGLDLIFGDGGNDTIYGHELVDTIDGGSGADMIVGSQDDDILRGGADNDVIYGDDQNNTTGWSGYGHDTIWGDAGADTLSGGDGNDTIHGGTENDTLWGNAGNDTLNGDENNDILYGDFATENAADGNDVLSGGAGNDSLIGNGGMDTLNGGDGTDTLWGGTGNDTLSGGNGVDTLNGQDGDDILGGGDGSDILTGGAGADIYLFQSGESGLDTIYGFNTGDGDKLDIADIIDFNPASDTITDFVQITDNGTDSTLAVDADGTANGTNFVSVATLLNVTGLTDEAALYNSGNGNLIAA